MTPALQAVLERVIWAPAYAGQVTTRFDEKNGRAVSATVWVPSRCRCCGRAWDLNERLSHERDGRDHAQGCAVLDLLAALRAQE